MYKTEYDEKLKVICLWKLCGTSNYKANVQQNLALGIKLHPIPYVLLIKQRSNKLSIHTTAVFH